MKLSIVIHSKNDGRNGTLNTTLDCLANLPVEVVVVDWGSEVPLDLSRFNVKRIYVPPDIAAKYNKDSDYAPNIALNVGIRRATGEYICISGNDIIYKHSTFDSLLNLLNNKETLYGISRIHISPVFSRRRLSKILSHIEKNVEKPQRIVMGRHPFGGCGVLILHRDGWHKVRGLREDMIYWGWSDIELALRLLMLGYKLQEVYEVSVYHIKHSLSNRRKINVSVIPGSYQANDEDWGLWKEEGVIYE